MDERRKQGRAKGGEEEGCPMVGMDGDGCTSRMAMYISPCTYLPFATMQGPLCNQTVCRQGTLSSFDFCWAKMWKDR